MVEEKNRQVNNKNFCTDKIGDNCNRNEIDNKPSITNFSNIKGELTETKLEITVIGANSDCNKSANSTIDSRACNKPVRKVIQIKKKIYKKRRNIKIIK